MHFKAVFFSGQQADLVSAVQQFRRTLFVDRYGWQLVVDGDREVDAFDIGDTVHLALFSGREICATFRAVRTDRPYLAAEVFPQLAVLHPYPHRADVWEISRFGVLSADADTRKTLAVINYALMFWLGWGVGARSLVAIADLAYERFLRSLGIRTRRYGPPQIIGEDRHGRALRAVAGDIPLALQDPGRLAQFFAQLDTVEINDVADVFGPVRVSA